MLEMVACRRHLSNVGKYKIGGWWFRLAQEKSETLSSK
jgi:hypothetical protein